MTIIGQLTRVVVQFAALIIFSHFLSPHDVGLIAMLAVFLYLGDLLRDFGLSQAAMQTAKLTHGQATNLFWTNTFVGVLMTCALWLAAPLVAGLYSEPALVGIAPWVALTFTINAVQAQLQVRLARDLRFIALTVTDVGSQLVGLAVGLVCLFAGAGYWSLVAQMITIYASLLVLRASIAHWRPGLPRRESGMKALYLFGAESGTAQLIQYAASNLDSFTIGIRYGAAPLGLYNRAFQMSTVPGNQLLTPLTNVALPFLSRRRHEGGDFYPLLWKAQVVLSAIFTFTFVIAGALAVPLVQIFLGSAWGETAVLLSILSIGTAVQMLSYMAFWAFLASGNSRQLLYHSLVTKPLLAACILIGSFAGVRGVAWGFTVGLTLSWFISMEWLRRCDSMPVSIFLRSGVHTICCGLVAGSATWGAIKFLQPLLNPVLLILAGALCATAIYAPLLLARPSTRELISELSGPAMALVKRKIVRPSRRA